jgi:hypothetical protein
MHFYVVMSFIVTEEHIAYKKIVSDAAIFSTFTIRRPLFIGLRIHNPVLRSTKRYIRIPSKRQVLLAIHYLSLAFELLYESFLPFSLPSWISSTLMRLWELSTVQVSRSSRAVLNQTCRTHSRRTRNVHLDEYTRNRCQTRSRYAVNQSRSSNSPEKFEM